MDDPARLRHELRTYETELEQQNETLRQALKDLEASRTRYIDLYQSAPVGFITLGLHTRLLNWNHRAATILDLPRARANNRRFKEFLPGQSGTTFERFRTELLAKGDPVTFELEMRRATGGAFWAEISMNLARDETDGSLVLRVALTDGSERKRMQDGLARLAAIVDSADHAIVSETLGGIITSWNPGAERLFGYTAEEMLGHSMEMVMPDTRTQEARQLRGTIQRGQAVACEADRVRRDGTVVPVFLSATPIMDPGGRVTGVSHIMRTIIEQVEARRELARLLGNLREADRRKDEFIATLAHELRNPLAPIRNAAAVLKFTPDLDRKVQWCRDVIERQVGHMATLLDDLLDVSRLTRNMISLRREPVDLGVAIGQAVEVTRPVVESRGHRLEISLPEECLVVEGDLTRLVQIFGNLINNAAKYTDPGGSISVTVECDSTDVEVRVRDNGIGIDREHLPRVFELFSQVNPGRSGAEPGLGIGLALVKGLVERHGGSIVAESGGLGMGSEFVVTLPRATRNADGSDASAQQRDSLDRVTASRRILVVDDNLDAAQSMAMMLRLHGYDVKVTSDPERAVKDAEEYEPHVILLDIGMPKLDGFAVARLVREQPWGRDIILVACTGWGQAEDVRRTREAGFDHHVVKPAVPEVVLKVVSSSSRAQGDLTIQ